MNGFVIPADPDVGDAVGLHASLAKWVGSAGQDKTVDIDLSHADPNQVALQLLIAAHRALEMQGATVKPGDNARTWLDRVSPSEAGH